MNRPIGPTLLVLACLAMPPAASAQTANSSPTSGTGAGGGVSRTAPSGGTAMPDAGQPQIGPATPLERHEEKKSQKDTDICKGC